MPAPPFVGSLLGWRVMRTGRRVPNTADTDNNTSLAISADILRQLGITHTNPLSGAQAGRKLEEAVASYLGAQLPALDPSRQWGVRRGRVVSDFDQYAHLARLQSVIDRDTSRVLSTEIGTDYLIAPDVAAWIPSRTGEFLHAAIPCKWTIRSDRVQNIRHEGIVLTRHRRGRQPHIVVVTPEPLPTRLASIARGTGEVDAVYHLVLDELKAATATVGTRQQKETLDELTSQKRVLPFDDLAPTLIL
jgi:NgoMIV restriction enzyme